MSRLRHLAHMGSRRGHWRPVTISVSKLHVGFWVTLLVQLRSFWTVLQSSVTALLLIKLRYCTIQFSSGFSTAPFAGMVGVLVRGRVMLLLITWMTERPANQEDMSQDSSSCQAGSSASNAKAMEKVA